MKTFWLSFASAAGALGVVIIKGRNLEDAVDRSWKFRCNPGGEVVGVELESHHSARIPKEKRNRLLEPPEARALVATINGLVRS